MTLPIALQLYSVRDNCADDLLSVLEQVADWGYDGVEFAGLHGHKPQAIRQALDKHGLRCAGAHVPADQLDDENIAETLKGMAVLKCPYVIVPYLPAERRNTPEVVLQTAAWFTRLANAVELQGFLAGFHCHDDDLKPLVKAEGLESCAWYQIGRNTPASFILQYDTANGMAVGLDPLQPLQDFPGRAVSLHLKEFVVNEGESGGAGHGQACIGSGDVPWTQVLSEAQGRAGTRWLVVEQEGHPTLDPMDAAKACLNGLRGVMAK